MSSSPAQEASNGRKRYRLRSNYFLVGDLVWTRPAKLPFWPAEVLDCDESANRVRARLLSPPPAELLAANLAEETRKHQQLCRREEARHSKLPKREAAAAPVALPEPEADVVTVSGQAVYFFDKLRTTAELDACLEDRLQRGRHDVSAYEAAFTQAVLQANRLVRIPLSPERLLPYEVCAVGIVHSLMRAQIAAPRQPNTGTFEPQAGLIRLRSGFENAARDLSGFEFIWVLFQFSFAAPMASGEGQESIRLLREARRVEGTAAEVGEAPNVTEATSSPSPAVHEADGPSSGARAADDGAQPESASSVLSAFRRRQGFDRAPGFKTMIVPPRDEEWRGVFATRSPHRPNFIGLSCVRLVAVHGLDIHIADHDLLHGTPVLDIKPYLPFCDAHPEARAGWVEALEASGKGKGDHKYDKQETLVDRITKQP